MQAAHWGRRSALTTGMPRQTDAAEQIGCQARCLGQVLTIWTSLDGWTRQARFTTHAQQMNCSEGASLLWLREKRSAGFKGGWSTAPALWAIAPSSPTL